MSRRQLAYNMKIDGGFLPMLAIMISSNAAKQLASTALHAEKTAAKISE